jgi:S1-C subfamily serine protease
VSAIPVAFCVLLAGGVAVVYWRAVQLEESVARLSRLAAQASDERGALGAALTEERRRAAAARRDLRARVERHRHRVDRLRRELDASHASAARLEEELGLARERLAALDGERSAAETIIRTYGRGVCLIQAIYAFYDDRARPLRHQPLEEGRSRNDDDPPALGVEGRGRIYTVDTVGTGFLVDPSGLVMTNRHVAEPWWNDASDQGWIAKGFRPRFVLFRAFFPGELEPFALETLDHSEARDVAIVRMESPARRIPILPLDKAHRGAVPGQPVVLLGYPRGLEAIMAKADPPVVEAMLEADGSSAETLADGMSRRLLIRPSATQGHIGDVTATDIVFDALTTVGGSGGPVFNRNGRVIAVGYAVLSEFAGSSFGVPIGVGARLLDRVVRRASPVPDERRVAGSG